MDSGNSGSLQSSSGGDEEYDSRAADSVSAFMSGGTIPDHTPAFGDPLSTYLQLNHDPSSSLLNPNLSWPRISAPSLRSDPSQIGHHSMLPTSTSFMPCFQPGIGADCGGGTMAAPLLNQNQAAARNPKKRSRASRRAPTTVLTTDTSNFRAMVQEFTGIPSPPFNSSAFPRSRLDLFGTRSTSFDAAQPPPYLRRPFAQKIHPPHPFLSSSSAALDATTNNTTAEAAVASSSTLSASYQLPITQSSNLFNIPNQNIITSLLQSNPKFQFPTSKPQNSFEIPSNDHQIKIGGLDDQFVLRHNNQVSETLTALTNITASDQVSQRKGHDAADTSNADQVNLNLLNGRYDFQSNPMSDQMSVSASSRSEFRGGKAPESFGVRGEGTVESWICSSE